MTVCIATLCENRKAIVLAADRMVSTSAFSADDLATSKIRRLHKNWWAMIAANDLPPVFSVLDTVAALLPDAPTLANVEDALSNTFARERLRRSETGVLGPYGLTMQDFINEGRTKLGDALFRQLFLDISMHRIAAELIVAGFDPDELGHVLSINDPGQVDRHELPGFYAIGAGALGALSMLYYRSQDYTEPIELSLFQTNEAKIFGGFAPGVGWDTELAILRPNQEPRFLTTSEVDKIDDLWIAKTKPNIPDRLAQRLRRFVMPPAPKTAKRPSSRTRTSESGTPKHEPEGR